MTFKHRNWRLSLYVLLILAGVAVAAGLAMRQAQRHAVSEDAVRAGSQLALYANTLHTLIERYRALPSVLALDPEIRAALSGPVTEDVQNQLDRKSVV